MDITGDGRFSAESFVDLLPIGVLCRRGSDERLGKKLPVTLLGARGGGER
jgi:hypothetical protein